MNVAQRAGGSVPILNSVTHKKEYVYERFKTSGIVYS